MANVRKNGKMKIIRLDNVKEAVTGGQKYNVWFADALSRHLNAEVISNEPRAYGYHPFEKLLDSFYELRWLGKCHNSDYILFPDTSYGRLFLLALFTRLKKGCRSLVIIHHFPYLNESGVKKVVEFIKQYLFYALIKEIVTPNRYTLDMAHGLYPHKGITLIPLPFELVYSPSTRYTVGEYLYVGTIEKRKGLSFLLDALGLVDKESTHKFNLHIVGKVIDESYYLSLKRQAGKLGIGNNVHFYGRVSPAKLVDLYKKAEIFTFPSLLEGFGMVLVEAMSHGVPVIAFNNSAMPYTIRDGVNGLLARNKSPESMAEQIMRLSGNKELRQALQEGMKSTIGELNTSEDFKAAIESHF